MAVVVVVVVVVVVRTGRGWCVQEEVVSLCTVSSIDQMLEPN